MHKRCIHIQCYRPHLKYTLNLIKGFFFKAKDINEYDFIVVVDNNEEKSDLELALRNISVINHNSVYVKTIKEILSRDFDYLNFNESYEACDSSISNNKNLFDGDNWGSATSYTRKWCNVKRTYGLLEIERLGYEHVWCVDSESYPLKEFLISDIFEYTVKNNFLAVYKYGSWNDYRIINKVLKISKNEENKELFNIGVRINDFWVIKLDYFKLMIKELTELHKNPVSYFMEGCEQALYELFLYHKYLLNEIDLTVFDFDKKYFADILELPTFDKGDCNIYSALHFLFQYASALKNIDQEKFIDRIQNLYFNKTYCYRGDFMNLSDKNLTKKLNLKFAVSNYQDRLKIGNINLDIPKYYLKSFLQNPKYYIKAFINDPKIFIKYFLNSKF